MATQPKDGGLKSHHISGLSEDLTPSSSAKDITDTAPVPSETSTTTTSPQQASGGGVTGYLKSWIGGGQPEPSPHGEQKTTHTQDLKDGSTAAVQTAPNSSAVPTSLQESPHTVGSATTQIQPPVSEYASALEGIAGQPVAPDPTAKYGPALGTLTGDAPAQGTGTGVVGAVTAAAGSVVQTVKHAVGYEDDPADASSNTSRAVEQPGQTSQGGLPPLTSGTGGNSGYTSGNTGFTGGNSGYSGDNTQGTGGSSTGVTGGSSTGVITPADLPKSGVVNTDNSGVADVTARQQPGYLSSAAGAVSGAAAGLKNSVTGLVGGGTQNAGTGTGPTSGQERGVSAQPTILYEDEGPTSATAGTSGATGTPAVTTGTASSATAAPSATTAGTSSATAAPSATTGGASSTTAAPSATTGGASSTTAAPSATTGGPSSATAAPSATTAERSTGAAKPSATAAGATAAGSSATANPISTTAPSSTTTTPASGAGTSSSVPTEAKGTTTSGTTTAPTTKTEPAKEASSSVSASKSQPPVSAFAADSKSPKGGKTGEITEEAGAKKAGQAAAATKGDTKTAGGKDAVKKAETEADRAKAAAEKPAGTSATKQEDKQKSKCCGCVIQ